MRGWKNSVKSMVVALAALTLVGTQGVAHAVPMLELSSGGTTVTIADEGVLDQFAGAGTVSWSGAVGVFGISVTVGVSKPIIGAADAPSLHLTSLNVTTSGAGSLTVKFTDTDFTLPLAASLDSFRSVIGGATTGGTVDSFDTYFDETNTAFGTGTFLAGLGPFATAGFSAQSSTGLLPLSSPYSLTMIATITHTGVGQATSIDATLAAVPEPSTVLLLGSGLVGLGWWAWRRTKKEMDR